MLIVEWLHLTGERTRIERDTRDREQLVRHWVRKNAPQLRLMPLVNNYDETAQKWAVDATVAMLGSEESRQTFIDDLFKYVTADDHAGAVLDLEQIPADSMDDYVRLVEEIAQRFRARDLELLVAVPARDDAYAYDRLAAAADALIVMTYDEHHEHGDPGPLAGQGWFEQILDERFANIDGSKIIVSIGAYGYDWSEAGKGRDISVQEAWELLEESDTKLQFDSVSLNPTFSYLDDTENKRHQVWFLDAVTGYNQIAAALAMKPRGLALWRLGTEDPGIWSAFARGRKPDTEALAATNTLRSGYDLLYKGEGEVLQVTGTHQPGRRTVSFDAAHNLITNQDVAVFPKSMTVTRWGARKDKVIAITFDDGPSREYTPQILDILAEKNVQATFFLIGSNAAVNRDLLRRIYAEGHDIGNHTFTHVNSAEVGSDHLTLELNATQRLFEATLGIRTELFRPPYAEDLEPKTVDSARPLTISASLGYLTIGMNIDPKDWYRPMARQIVAASVQGALKREGNVLLLHDSGGDRSATVEALPQIIDQLRAEGFRFVTVHELLGQTREAIMPKVEPQDAIVASLNGAGFALYSGASNGMNFIFAAGIALGTMRLLMVGVCALFHNHRQRRRSKDLQWWPRSLTVIVPAFNEEKVICASIGALLASPTEDFDIIVVDDGSTDRTVELVREAFGGNDRVRLITKTNGGKASALNVGLQHTKSEIVVMLDADTVFEPDALALLVRNFADPRVAAVAGAARVGNRTNLITGFQALEYIASQNLDRRALELVNAITVVPGSIGAWRRRALVRVGGFSTETLAEDADATIKLERAGWKVLYEPEAIALTEAPETLRSFLKQRFRWMFGMLQVAFKHRSAFASLRSPGVAYAGLTNVVVFQFLFTLISPIIDLMLIWGIYTGFRTWEMHPTEGLPPTLVTIVGYWAFFQLLEIGTTAMAMSIDRQTRMWHLLPLIFLQRFCYRQLLYIVAIRSLGAAIKGQMVGWGKLMRTGRVAKAAQLR